MLTSRKSYFPLLTAQKEYEDWLPNPAKSAIEPSEYSSSNSTDIHGDYYTYGTQFDQIPPISTNFLHVFNTTPNGTFTETKWKQIPTTSLQSGNINADQEETESHPSLTSNAFP